MSTASIQLASPGAHAPGARVFRRVRGFTLIELILVMGMLLVVIGVAFPTLRHFFHGQTLDSEAHRFLSLTRYGQSRAVSEGIPMVLWVDVDEGTYGLEAQAGYVDYDEKAVEYALEDDVEMEVEEALISRSSNKLQPVASGLGNLPVIRFMPEGFIGETSPNGVMFRQDDVGEVWITLNSNRLNYAIEPANNEAGTTRY